MDKDALRVRSAVEADAPAIASIHVRGWQWAYRGLMPDAVLDGLSVERREAGWRQHIATPAAAAWTGVAERGEQVLGFVHIGASRDGDAPPGTAEVYAIYVDPQAVGTGVGRALLAQAVAGRQRQGYRAA